MKPLRAKLAPSLLLLALAGGLSQLARSQSLDLDRGRARLMLKVIKDDIKKNYYDPAFHGVDIETRFTAADEELKKATSLGHTFAIIADFLSELDDSHTFFLPPPRSYRVEYGWQMQMVGDACHIVAVKPGSDAEAKGVKVGDRVLSLDGLRPRRETAWKLKYVYYTLGPRRGARLVLKSPEGQPRQLDVMASVKQGKSILDLTGESEDIWEVIREAESEDRLQQNRYVEMGNPLIIWKMPTFLQEEKDVDRMMSRVKKHEALILDLRGNQGGAVKTLERLAGHFFDRGVKIAERKGRKAEKPQVAKRLDSAVFSGKLVVLVDSESASAAELFARVVQLEKRGTVLGDRTAGAVMEARYYGHQLGADTIIVYGMSVTDADLIMADGKSLEKVGVLPDELVLPTAADLAASRDPVLSRAAALLGVDLSSEKAGALFPVEWRK